MTNELAANTTTLQNCDALERVSPRMMILNRPKSVMRVSAFLGSVIDLISGIVPIAYSADKWEGHRRSQELKAARYAQCSCRYGQGSNMAGLLFLQGHRIRLTLYSIYKVDPLPTIVAIIMVYQYYLWQSDF